MRREEAREPKMPKGTRVRRTGAKPRLAGATRPETPAQRRARLDRIIRLGQAGA